MPRPKEVLTGTGIAVGGVFCMFLWLAGACIHLYTVLMAFSLKGFIAAFITLCLPVAAEAYWIFFFWQGLGEFLNGYTVLILAYVALWLLAVGVGLVAAFIGSRVKG